MITSAWPTGASTHDTFLELLCGDEELLRAEFEDIVAHEWPRPPDRRAVVRIEHVGADGGPAPGCPRSEQRRQTGDRLDGVDAWARQRSPPAAC